MKFWFGVLLLFVGSLAGYAGIWTALPLGAIGMYFLLSSWAKGPTE